MTSTTDLRLAFSPRTPLSLETLGIPRGLVLDLVLRHLYIEGLSSLQSISDTLKLALPVAETVFRQFRQQHLLDVKGMVGDDYSFTLTAQGRERAAERFRITQYVGPAPVSLRDYHSATKAQAAKVRITRQVLREALSDLVVTDRLIDQLGPAVISQTSIFLYGPTGNGKSSLAERLLRMYTDAILIPYAVEVDNQIIMLFDPAVHQQVDAGDSPIDPRWVVCRRPSIAAGGELVGSMLELRLDEASGVYAAPLQMKANNGVLIIDDFGRQIMSPRDLLNRWIVPLDRRLDYLTLRYGMKFQIPFELMVVFATNLDPGELADEAFLRRIRNKVYVEPVDPETFDEILRRVVTERGLPCDDGVAELLRKCCLRYTSTLRACYPADICSILSSIGQYEDRPARVDKESLEKSVKLYFTRTAVSAIEGGDSPQ